MMHYKDKKVAVLGLGRSGLAAARLLKDFGAIPHIFDSNTGDLLQERAAMLRDEGMTVFLAPAGEHQESYYDLAILSPGIEESVPLVRWVIEKKIPIMSEIELAYSLSPHPVVAITGSNGKTTTTELTERALQGAGVRALACGNIGLPFSEAILKSSDYDLFVVEVSSFQLEKIKKFRPRVAVWLNLSPNHLDRYASIEEYRAAKLRIFKNQNTGDVAVIPKNFDQQVLPSGVSCITFSATEQGGIFSFEKEHLYYQGRPFLDSRTLQLRGLHNIENLMAALGVGVSLGLDLKLMAEAIKNYTPPAHRCELVLQHDGITWINDSKATTLDAMEKAICSVPKASPIILIAGGKNKGSSFAPIFPLVRERVKEVILIGERSDLIIAEWPGMGIHKAQSLEEAVSIASAKAAFGDTILLSPGTSSYDMFKDYQERGDRFKKAVVQLTKHH